MAGVGHQIGDHRLAAEPGQDHGDHIAHHHDPIGLACFSQQPPAALEQIEHLPLQDFFQAAGEAGVAQAAGAEALGAACNWQVRLPVGRAIAHQGHSAHLSTLLLQRLPKTGTTEVFPVAVAEQQQLHLSPPARPAPSAAPASLAAA